MVLSCQIGMGTHDTVGSAYGNLLDLEMPGPVFVRGQNWLMLFDPVKLRKMILINMLSVY